MDKILELKQKRAETVKKMRAMIEAAETGQRSLTDEEDASYKALREEAERLKRDLEREEELRRLESQMPKQFPNGTSRTAFAREEKLEPGVRFARFVKASLVATREGGSIVDMVERMYPQDEMLRAAMTEGTAADGGTLVPVNLYNEIIPLLREVSIVRGLGASELPLPNGNMKIPKQTGAANFTWVGENKPIASSKPVLGFMSLSAKKLSGLIPLSNELLADASISADMFVRNELVNGIAEAEDITALYGTGNDYQPKGITVACAANKITVNGEITSDVLDEMMGKALSAKLVNPNFIWSFPGQIWSKIYGMKTATGNYIYRDEMKDGMLLGRPFKIWNSVKVGTDANAKTQIFLGDWKHFMIGKAAELQIAVSSDAAYTVGDKLVSAFENDLTLMRAILREDFGVRYDEAFIFADAVYSKGKAPVETPDQSGNEGV